jgi:hypothetical protein
MFVVKLLWMFMYNYSCNLGIFNDINTHVYLYIKVHLQTVAILEFIHSMRMFYIYLGDYESK